MFLCLDMHDCIHSLTMSYINLSFGLACSSTDSIGSKNGWGVLFPFFDHVVIIWIPSAPSPSNRMLNSSQFFVHVQWCCLLILLTSVHRIASQCIITDPTAPGYMPKEGTRQAEAGIARHRKRTDVLRSWKS